MNVKVCGGGMFYWWEIGALERLDKNVTYKFYTISCGSIATVFYLSNIKFETIIKSTEQFISDNNIKSFYNLYPILDKWLNKCLPENIHQLCNQTLNICTFNILSLKTIITNTFSSKQHLINTLISSINLPIHPKFFYNFYNNFSIDHITNVITNIHFDIIINPVKSTLFSKKKMFKFISIEEATLLYNDGKNNDSFTTPLCKTTVCNKEDQRSFDHPFKNNILLMLISAMFTAKLHFNYNKTIAKGLIPGILSLFAIRNIINNSNIIVKPYEYQKKYTNLIYIYIGHTIADVYFIHKDKPLLLHHLITLCGASYSIINPKYRNISISLLASEVLPFATGVRKIVHNKSLKQLINIIRVITSAFYRIPLILNILNKTNYTFMKSVLVGFGGLEIFWLSQLINFKNNKYLILNMIYKLKLLL